MVANFVKEVVRYEMLSMA